MEKRKDVLMICADEWGRCFTGFGGNSIVMTPTLDQLARDGIQFDNCFSSCPICIPARRSIMTGMFPSHHGDRVYSDMMPMPDAVTLAQAFSNAGYQTMAVGKLHVYPQRNRIGFDDAIITEEGRYEFGNVDDYQTWLGENGFAGQEFMHSMGNNSYYTRPWHLPEYTHPTMWVTKEMCRQIKRRDPDRPHFWYVSYQFPHPPLVPLQSYLDMYEDDEIDMPEKGLDDWNDDSVIMHLLREQADEYNEKDIRRAKKAYYAQCTLIDHQIRILIGTLRECNLLDNTIICFLSDHGDSLFNHSIVGKRTFYQESCNVPFLISGAVVKEYRGQVSHKLACLEDIMPTLLSICGIDIPKTVDGLDLLSSPQRERLYCEVGEGRKATRMTTDGRYKLIYYPCGNIFQLFDIVSDPFEHHNLYGKMEYSSVQTELMDYLISELHGTDDEWLENGKLKGFDSGEYRKAPDYGLYNQRGWHWPAPQGYSNLGKT